jgi:inosine/xanthosine triphosphate pyrophosphatase family protein
LGKTLAEVSPEEKWAVSHRGNAFRDLLRQLVAIK